MTNKLFDAIYSNVQTTKERIAKAASKAGRNNDEITLLGVTKTQNVDSIKALINAGVTQIGENRVQELLEKQEQLAGVEHKMHMIGNVQNNKVKFLPRNIDLLQSLESVKMAKSLEKVYAAQSLTLDVLIQVNIAGEKTKYGVSVEQLPYLTEYALSSQVLTLRGLMCIPPFGLGEGIQRYFEQMRRLFVDIQAEKMDNNRVDILSMGMSDDFEYAIAEGSTMVRLGTRLFGRRI